MSGGIISTFFSYTGFHFIQDSVLTGIYYSFNVVVFFGIMSFSIICPQIILHKHTNLSAQAPVCPVKNLFDALHCLNVDRYWFFKSVTTFWYLLSSLIALFLYTSNIWL